MHHSAASSSDDGESTPVSSPASVSPSFHGYVETTIDALRLIYAARQGVIPRITRRFSNLERERLIKSGAVFVFNVREAGITRWTGVYHALEGPIDAEWLIMFDADGMIWCKLKGVYER